MVVRNPKSGVQKFNTDFHSNLPFKVLCNFSQITGVMKKIVSDIIGTEKCVWFDANSQVFIETDSSVF